MVNKKWTYKRVLKHFLFWVAYHLINTFVYGNLYNDYQMIFFGDLQVFPLKLIITYFTIYYLIPKFILKKKKVFFFVIYFVLFSFAIILISNFFLYYSNPSYDFYNPYVILKYLLYSYPVVGVVVAIKYWNHWFQNQLFQERLMKEKFEAELKMLRSQIHPHFLFNTINNIYSLTLEKSNRAPVALLKLSEILNYVLYECNSDKVPLEKEIALLRNYFSLEKIRYEDRLDVLFNIRGEVNNVKIAPLLLLTFAENSFKHGVRQIPESAWISVDIMVENDSITIKIENSKNEEPGFKSGYKAGSEGNSYLKGGIGLKNVKRRLDLIYPDRHQLEICDDTNSFLVLLKIGLVSSEIESGNKEIMTNENS